jgi:DNA-binding Lrp family transcriptional regulator
VVAIKAYVNIETKPGTAIIVVNHLRKEEKQVLSADAIYGRFDAVAVIQAPALEDIDKVVFEVIQSDPNVLKTETSIVLGLQSLK